MQARIGMRRSLPQATDSRSFGVEPPAGYWIAKRAIDIAISAVALVVRGSS